MRLLNSINHFINLLKRQKLEDSVKMYMADNILIDCNGKNKKIENKCWMRFLEKIFLNENTSIVQFNVSENNILENINIFTIHIICVKKCGQLFFTEIQISNTWIGNKISKLSYNTIHF